jgi:hypothetical protein
MMTEETINDPKFPAELKYCVDNPKSDEAKEMEKWISKLILKSSKNIPLSTVQSSSIAFSQLLALDRFLSTTTIFFLVEAFALALATAFVLAFTLAFSLASISFAISASKTTPLLSPLLPIHNDRSAYAATRTELSRSLSFFFIFRIGVTNFIDRLY